MWKNRVRGAKGLTTRLKAALWGLVLSLPVLCNQALADVPAEAIEEVHDVHALHGSFNTLPKFPAGTERETIYSTLDEQGLNIAGQTPSLILVLSQAQIGEAQDAAVETFVYQFRDGRLQHGPVNFHGLLQRSAYNVHPADWVADLRAFVLHTNSATLQNWLAWELATFDDPDGRHPETAIEIAVAANNVSNWSNAAMLDTLAAAHASAGDFPAALNYQSQAIAALTADEHDSDYRHRLALYRNSKAYSLADDPPSRETIKAARNGDAQALYDIAGYSLENGIDVDNQSGVYWLERAANAGHFEAQNEMGFARLYGRWEIEQDRVAAVGWLKRSAPGGDPLASINLAYLYADASFELHNEQESFRWLKTAAEYGFLDHKFELAFRYGSGTGTKQDLQKKQTILQELDELSYEPVNYLIARRYFSELPNVDLLMQVLSERSISPHALSGLLVDMALDIDRQLDTEHETYSLSGKRYSVAWHKSMAPEMTFHLYEAAARLDDAYAQQQLAALYGNGTGTPKSVEAQTYWSKRAAVDR